MGGKSNVDDWLFLVLCIVIIAAFFGYENADTATAWMHSLSAPVQPVPNSEESSGAVQWLIGNWGKALLIGAVLAWVVKHWLAQRTAPATEEGPVIKYDTYRHVKVTLVN